MKLKELLEDLLPFMEEEVESASFLFNFKNEVFVEEDGNCKIRFYGALQEIANDMGCLQREYSYFLSGQLNELYDKEKTLKWLVKNMHVASGLLELKLAPEDNEIFEGWTHNGIPIINKEFDLHHQLIRELKYGK